MLTALLAGLFGLLIGSFLNVCIYRLPRGLSVVRPRSYCPQCSHGVAWYDNVPLLSYLLLRGRCRNCGVRIPIRYPLVELLTGLAFFAAVWNFGDGLRAVKVCVFAAILIELTFSDLETQILPDGFTLGGVIVGLAFAFFVPIPGGFFSSTLLDAAAGAAGAAGALWLVGILYRQLRKREGLGFGDVKMVAMMGAFLGLQGVLLALVLGSVLGAVIGLAYIVLASKDASTYELPFGTFLGLAGLVLALFGEPVLIWYSRLGGGS